MILNEGEILAPIFSWRAPYIHKCQVVDALFVVDALCTLLVVDGDRGRVSFITTKMYGNVMHYWEIKIHSVSRCVVVYAERIVWAALQIDHQMI